MLSLQAADITLAVGVFGMTVGLPAPYASFLALSISQFTLDVIEKFKRGHQEHGGNLFDADLDKEIHAEHLDLFVYQSAKKYKHLYRDEMNNWIKAHESTPQAIPAERT